jgi:hypothetical protein
VQLCQVPDPRGAFGLCPDDDGEGAGAVHGVAQSMYRKVGAQVSDRGGALGKGRVQRFQREGVAFSRCAAEQRTSTRGWWRAGDPVQHGAERGRQQMLGVDAGATGCRSTSHFDERGNAQQVPGLDHSGGGDAPLDGARHGVGVQSQDREDQAANGRRAPDARRARAAVVSLVGRLLG